MLVCPPSMRKTVESRSTLSGRFHRGYRRFRRSGRVSRVVHGQHDGGRADGVAGLFQTFRDRMVVKLRKKGGVKCAQPITWMIMGIGVQRLDASFACFRVAVRNVRI